MADLNEEEAQSLAQRRYGKDFQGAIRRVALTNAGIADDLQSKDTNAFSQQTSGKDSNGNRDNIIFALAFSTAP